MNATASAKALAEAEHPVPDSINFHTICFFSLSLSLVVLKLKNIKPTTLNRLRWIFLITPILWLILFYGLDFLIDYPNWLESILIILLLLFVIILAILMMIRKETITKKIIRFMIILVCVSRLIYLPARYVIPIWRIDCELDYMVREGFSVIAVS